MRARLRLIGFILAGGAALWFAIQGSEYSTADIIRQQRQRARLQREIDSLTRAVDSLTQYKQRVLNDPKMQERIAREEFGMVRGKELLYRFAEPDTTPPTPPHAR